MIVNLNSIRLDPCNGVYEEYPLRPNETGNVLPGAIVAVTTVTTPYHLYNGVSGTAQSTGVRQSEVDPPTNMAGVRLVPATEAQDAQGNPGEEGYQPAVDAVPAHYVIDKAYVTSQATDLSATEILIVTENSYEYAGINHKCIPGEIVHLRRAVSGDRYLIRAVEGNYVEGDPVYLTQTDNGIYVTKTGAEGATPIGYAGETYVVYGEDKPELTPKFYYDAIDDSTPVRAASRWLNGAVFNLLKVRIA